jgi:hypothetical protein
MSGQITGGCLCGALRYEADGPPRYAGLCYCADCRKASGSGFMPFMGFEARTIRFRGPAVQYRSRAFRGVEAVRNACPNCSSLVFGGEVGLDDSHTVYAGSLDDLSHFAPRIAIFVKDRPDWAPLPPGLQLFDIMPGMTAR